MPTGKESELTEKMKGVSVVGMLSALALNVLLIASADVGAKAGFRNFLKALAVFPALHFLYAAGVASGIWYSYGRGFSASEIKRRGKFSGLTR